MFYNSYPKVDLNNKQTKNDDKTNLLKEHTVTAYQEYKVTLDAGHGDNNSKNKVFDPGAVSGSNYEKDYALKIDAATFRWLSYFGTSTFRTRTNDIKVAPEGPINWRWKIANKRNSAIFISFHLNSGSSEEVFAVYQQGKSNSENSIKLAKSILENLKVISDTDESKIFTVEKKTRYTTLAVLNRFKGEAGLLFEFGGISSEENRNAITKNSSKIGFWIAVGIYKYLNNGLEPEIFKSTPSPLNNSTFGESFKAWASEK